MDASANIFHHKACERSAEPAHFSAAHFAMTMKRPNYNVNVFRAHPAQVMELNLVNETVCRSRAAAAPFNCHAEDVDAELCEIM